MTLLSHKLHLFSQKAFFNARHKRLYQPLVKITLNVFDPCGRRAVWISGTGDF